MPYVYQNGRVIDTTIIPKTPEKNIKKHKNVLGRLYERRTNVYI